MLQLGRRGEGWVALQAVFGLGYVVAPAVGPEWPFWLRLIAAPVGLLIFITGVVFGGYGLAGLGSSLSPFPRPKDDSHLVTAGIYGCVRHPVYGGLTMGAFGLALMLGSTSRLLAALALFGFFNLKASVEERWLNERYPGYAEYQRTVRRLLPGLW